MTVIDSIEVGTTRLPLARPLRLGATEITSREYVAVRLRSDDGLVGNAYALTREAPMAELIEKMLAPHYVGMPAADPSSAWWQAFRATALVGRVGLVRRALGLLDIAMWDLAAQREGVPLHALLGVGGSARPAMLVACYPAPGDAADTITRSLSEYAAEGWTRMKLSRSPDVGQMRELLRSLGEALGGPGALVIDAGYGWPDAEVASDEVRRWGNPRLAWLEDPILPEETGSIAELKRRVGMPIGVGDEVTDPEVLRRLMDRDAIDVLRLDVVALGGVTGARDILADARARGIPISAHIVPEVAVHLGVDVETFDRAPEGNPYDPSHTLVEGGPTFARGMATPPSDPGLGFRVAAKPFGWDAE